MQNVKDGQVRMTEILTSAQMRSIEGAAIESGAVTGAELMERAGAGVVDAILAQWPDMAAAPHRAVVLCGPGNNGGDGFVVARLLAARGWAVELFFHGLAERLPPAAARMHARWTACGPVQALSFPKPTEAELGRFRDCASSMPEILQGPETEADDPPQPPFLLVDALFGIGLTRPLADLQDVLLRVDYLATFPTLNNCRIVAIDVPSGLDADTGLYLKDDTTPDLGGMSADLTVTFHALKPGHLNGLGPQVCGAVRVADIGLAPWDHYRHDA